MVIDVAGKPVIPRLNGFEKVRIRLPLKAAETRSTTGNGADSLKERRIVKMPSFATASPCVPSSYIVLTTLKTLAIGSNRCRFTLPGIKDGSVIVAVTVTSVGVFSSIAEGLIVVAPILPDALSRVAPVTSSKIAPATGAIRCVKYCIVGLKQNRVGPNVAREVTIVTWLCQVVCH